MVVFCVLSEDFLHCCDGVTFCPTLHSIAMLDESNHTPLHPSTRGEKSERLEKMCQARRLFTSLNKQLQDNQLKKLIHNFEHSVHEYAGDNAILSKELWLLIGRSYLNMERLSWSVDVTDGYPHPIEMYQQCPNNLKCISIDSA
eukprot:scaffold5365_cov169-Ochromonas_danica.AAC.3